MASETSLRSIHYIVQGEGVRDSNWTLSVSAPLAYGNIPTGSTFSVLPVPPSPQNSIVPLVRIFPKEATPRYTIAPVLASRASQAAARATPPKRAASPPAKAVQRTQLPAQRPSGDALPARGQVVTSRATQPPAISPIACGDSSSVALAHPPVAPATSSQHQEPKTSATPPLSLLGEIKEPTNVQKNTRKSQIGAKKHRLATASRLEQREALSTMLQSRRNIGRKKTACVMPPLVGPFSPKPAAGTGVVPAQASAAIAPAIRTSTDSAAVPDAHAEATTGQSSAPSNGVPKPADKPAPVPGSSERKPRLHHERSLDKPAPMPTTAMNESITGLAKPSHPAGVTSANVHENVVAPKAKRQKISKAQGHLPNASSGRQSFEDIFGRHVGLLVKAATMLPSRGFPISKAKRARARRHVNHMFRDIRHVGIVSSQKGPEEIRKEGAAVIPRTLSSIGSTSGSKQKQSAQSDPQEVPGRKQERGDTPSRTDAKELLQVTRPAVKGIKYRLIQLMRAIATKEATIAKVDSEMEMLNNISKAVQSDISGTVSIPDQEVFQHVHSTSFSSSIIRYLMTEAGLSEQKSSGGERTRFVSSSQLKTCLLALKRLVLWIRYLSERLEAVCMLNSVDEGKSAQSESFHEELVKFLNPEDAKSSVVVTIRQLRKSLLDNPTEKDGKMYFEERKELCETVTIALKAFRRTMKRSLEINRSGNDSGTRQTEEDNTGRRSKGEGPERADRNSAHKADSRPTADRSTSAVTSTRKTPAGTQKKGAPANPLSAPPPPRNISKALSSRDANASGEGVMMGTRRGEAKSQSDSTTGPTSRGVLPTIPRRSLQQDKAEKCKPSPSASRAASRGSGETADFVKNILKESTRSGPSPRSTSTGKGQATSLEKRPSRGTTQRPEGVQTVAEPDVDGKKKKKALRVSFPRQLVTGRQDSAFDKDFISSLFTDQDILGSKNPEQQAALQERSQLLSRGAVFSLFAVLKSEVSGWKSVTEGAPVGVPDRIAIPYTRSMMKQVARLLASEQQSNTGKE